MSTKPFTWWWPSTGAGVAAFTVAMTLAGLTLFIFGPLAIINVAFWYLVCVGIRFVFIQANGGRPDQRHPNAS